MPKPVIVLPVLLLVGIVPLAAQAATDDQCPPGSQFAPAPLAFDEPLYIDKTRAGGEPVSIVAQDGSISVSAHAGTTHLYKDPAALAGIGDFAVDYWNQTLNWRSSDGGRSWQFVGFAGQRMGPHTATSTGFSDPDFAMDAGGRIYNTEIDLANVAVYSSLDDGQSYTVGSPLVSAGDRPWLTGGEKDEVYLYINLPRQLWRSADGGLTWSLLPTPPVNAKILTDPLNPTAGLIGPIGKDEIAISADKGQTWKRFPGARLGKDTNFFGVTAVDKSGNVYKVAAGGYSSATDRTADGQVSFNYFDRAAGRWGQPVVLDIPKGDALWPWVIAGDDGRVALTWYQNHQGKPDEFYAYAAYTTNGTGTQVTCGDGSSTLVPPQFSVANASGRPIHKGAICLAGTACNAGTDFVNGDRRLGDFFTINHDADGRLFIATGDTMLKSPTGGPKPVANPLFIHQSEGDRLLVEPQQPRPTRCLFPLPTC